MVKQKKKTSIWSSFKSGREDLNLRPLAPHASALAGLRHAPIAGGIIVSFKDSDNESVTGIVGHVFLFKDFVNATYFLYNLFLTTY